MNKKSLIISISVIIVLVAGFIVFTVMKQKAKPADTHTEATEETVPASELPGATKLDGKNSLVPDAVLQPTNFQVVKSGFSKNAKGERVVTGTIKNTSKRIYAPVEVQVTLQNDEDKVLTIKSTTLTLLEPGFTWEFEVPALDKSATHFKVNVFAPEKTSSDFKVQ